MFIENGSPGKRAWHARTELNWTACDGDVDARRVRDVNNHVPGFDMWIRSDV